MAGGLAFVAAAGLLALCLLLVRLADLAFRNPLRGAWLRRGGVISGGAFGCVTMLSFSIAWMISAGISLGLGLLGAVGAAIAVALLASFAAHRLLRAAGGLEQAGKGRPSSDSTAAGAGRPVSAPVDRVQA